MKTVLEHLDKDTRQRHSSDFERRYALWALPASVLTLTKHRGRNVSVSKSL